MTTPLRHLEVTPCQHKLENSMVPKHNSSDVYIREVPIQADTYIIASTRTLEEFYQ